MKITEFLIIDLDARDLVDLRTTERQALSLAELEVLKCLVSHVGDVVSKEQLNTAGWPGRVVAPSSLTQCMSSLRKKLVAQTDIELKNIPRYGYSLCIVDEHDVCIDETKAEAVLTAVQQQTEEDDALKSKRLNIELASRLLWSTLVILAGIIISMHFSGGLKKAVNYIALLAKPQIAAITTKNIEFNHTSSLVSKVFLDSQQSEIAQQATSVDELIANWFNYESVLPASSEKQLFTYDNGEYESVALCNDFDSTCSDRQPLNLVRTADAPVTPLDIQWLADTKLRMEQVTYNKILLDKFETENSGVVEDVYRADVYYYSDTKNVVRADVRLSMIFDSDNRGKLVAAACITDDMLREISIRYQFSGDFKLKQSLIDGKVVKTFLVDVDERSFTSPQQVSKESATIYREIRKNVLQNEQMVIRQVYQDEDSGVWMLPLWGETMVWAHREQVSL
ncbi:winged helix-turn-helix domain-containing protein [uncultured Shewanella sp.]|uniref:transcriptional regulator n=1 Tax=uncultured Shewanella sp. TaxID=173975 RepID=UPI00260E78A2|nr:winged helix-turn-helix domain-containing protein [uncultured Shewanella sp.]